MIKIAGSILLGLVFLFPAYGQNRNWPQNQDWQRDHSRDWSYPDQDCVCRVRDRWGRCLQWQCWRRHDNHWHRNQWHVQIEVGPRRNRQR